MENKMMDEVKEVKRFIFNEKTEKYEVKEVKMNRQGHCWITIESVWLTYPYSYISAGAAGFGLRTIPEYILEEINKEFGITGEWFSNTKYWDDFREPIERLVKEYIGADCTVEELVDETGLHAKYIIEIDGGFYIPLEDMRLFSIIACQDMLEASVYIEDQNGNKYVSTTYRSED